MTKENQTEKQFQKTNKSGDSSLVRGGSIQLQKNDYYMLVHACGQISPKGHDNIATLSVS